MSQVAEKSLNTSRTRFPWLGATVLATTAAGTAAAAKRAEEDKAFRERLPGEAGEILAHLYRRSVQQLKELQSSPALAGFLNNSDKQNAPQEGVVSPLTSNALFLTVYLREKKGTKQGSTLATCASIAAAKTMEFSKESAAVVGFSNRVWATVQSSVPAGIPVHPFGLSSRKGPHGGIPATGGDIFLHVKAEDRGECFRMARELLESLPLDAIDDAEDVYGFRYQGGKDILGYTLQATTGEDSAQIRAEAALVPTTGGSYALAQQWRHELYSASDLSQAELDAVIGKNKRNEYLGSVPLEKEPHNLAKAMERGLPETCHVARVIGVDQNGRRLGIVRQSMPCGNIAPGPVGRDNIHEPGLFFLAYCATPHTFNYMLDRMAGVPIRGSSSERRPSDSIMRYSLCLRGQMYYVPSLQQLQALADLGLSEA